VGHLQAVPNLTTVHRNRSRRAISVPLTPATSGVPRSLADTPPRRSAPHNSPDRTDFQADSAGSIPVTRSKGKTAGYTASCQSGRSLRKLSGAIILCVGRLPLHFQLSELTVPKCPGVWTEAGLGPAQPRVRNNTWPDWILAVPLSSVTREAVIADGKPRFCGKVLVDTRISPAWDWPAAR
jgi:hypothetical protein